MYYTGTGQQSSDSQASVEGQVVRLVQEIPAYDLFTPATGLSSHGDLSNLKLHNSHSNIQIGLWSAVI